jgi:pyruvate/2-oxoglutarate dehydrogenase complex dihydrolipoamide dehydrogenase (E3) component
MEANMYDVIVIGGGPAGVTAALRTRELGASVALVERDRLGGTCTNDGCVPTRVLAKAARLIRDAEQYPDYGFSGSKPELDFERLMRRVQRTVYTIHEKKQLISHLTQSGAEVFSEVGPARFTDPHTIELPDGTSLVGDKFILCAGGRARRLDFPGAELTLTHSDIWSLKKSPRTMVIVGGAATGCQVASIMEAFGTHITILERAPKILGVEDDAVTQLVQQEFEKRDIHVITGIGNIHKIERASHGLDLSYDAEGQEYVISADAIVLSAGWVGNLSSLNLSAAGVETAGPYVKVDDHLRTNAPHIFAAGDITGRMMLVQSASYEALAAAENALLGSSLKLTHKIVPHGGFTDPEYGSVGLTEAAARQNHDCVVTTVPYSEMDRAVIDDRTVGLCKLIVNRENHRILGVHVVGEQALEIVHVVAAAMVTDMWVEQLAEIEIAYPTFTTILGLAARRIVNDLGVRPLAKEWRSLEKPVAAEWERKADTGN